MAHTRPQRVIQAEVMAAPAVWFEAWHLAVWFEAWHLAVECRGDRCPTGRHWPMRKLLAGRRGQPTVADLVAGLRCSGCRERPDRVTLVERLPERVGGRAFRLVGVGAYG